MASPLDKVRSALQAFLGGEPFKPFWIAVMEATEFVDADAGLSDAERDWFDELYDLAYMAAEDPVDAESHDAGIVGAEELRKEIRALRLDGPHGRLPNER
jgi:hypothetical protein